MAEAFTPVFSNCYHTRGPRDAAFARRTTPSPGFYPSLNLYNEAYNPIHPTLRDGVPYEDLLTCFYNVKTWRFAGAIGLFSFDETVQAGCRADYGYSEVPDISAPPNDGKRGVYCTRFNYTDSSTSGATGEAGLVSVGIGSTSTSAQTTPEEALSLSSDNPGILVPYIYIRLYHVFSDSDVPANDFGKDISAYPQSDHETAEDTSITFLGHSIHTHAPPIFDGPPDTYSLTITAESYWTPSDPWVKFWT